MSKQNRIIYRRADGVWENQRNDSDRVSSLHTTQKAAENAARKILTNQGGEELTIKDENGRIRSKETIGSGNDRYPPRDKKTSQRKVISTAGT